MNRVLVVEDEDDVRELLKTILTGNGFEVFTASSGEEALVKVGEVGPDLVVLDLVLPGLSGLEVCRLLKSKESTRGVSRFCLCLRWIGMWTSGMRLRLVLMVI